MGKHMSGAQKRQAAKQKREAREARSQQPVATAPGPVTAAPQPGAPGGEGLGTATLAGNAAVVGAMGAQAPADPAPATPAVDTAAIETARTTILDAVAGGGDPVPALRRGLAVLDGLGRALRASATPDPLAATRFPEVLAETTAAIQAAPLDPSSAGQLLRQATAIRARFGAVAEVFDLSEAMEGFHEGVAMETFRGREDDDQKHHPNAGHALSRHGSHHGSKELKERVTKGLDPGDQTKQAFTKVSSQWATNRDALAVRETAESHLMSELGISDLTERGAGGKSKVVVLINHGRDIAGDVYKTAGTALDVDTNHGGGKKTWKEGSVAKLSGVQTSRTLFLWQDAAPGRVAGWFQMQHFPDGAAVAEVPAPGVKVTAT